MTPESAPRVSAGSEDPTQDQDLPALLRLYCSIPSERKGSQPPLNLSLWPLATFLHLLRSWRREGENWPRGVREAGGWVSVGVGGVLVGGCVAGERCSNTWLSLLYPKPSLISTSLCQEGAQVPSLRDLAPPFCSCHFQFQN